MIMEKRARRGGDDNGFASRRAKRAAEQASRRRWRRAAWALAGALALVVGLIGVVVPLLPTTPFVLLAAFCFARSSERCERWMLEHARFGPIVRDWRARRAVPLRAKQFATVMMATGCISAAFLLPARVAWLPALVCTVTAVWLWRLPTRRE
jgi:uncharacterized membrane protein YbaN (DUF454 family)